MPNRLSKALLIVLGLSSILFFLHASDVLSKNIGLYHDELWDFIPAVGIISSHAVARPQEIRIFHHSIPLVSGPYQGALKAWIAAPFLGLLGTSPRVILSLNVLFCVTYLLALYWALLPAVGRSWACLVFMAPLFDSNFLLTAPMDAGPSLFQDIFIALAIGALFRYLSNSELKYCWLAWFFGGCILAQKLTAIPVVISFAVIIAILSWKKFLMTARTGKARWAVELFMVVPACVFLIPLIPHLAYFLKSGLADLFSMTADGRRMPYFAAIGQNFSFFRTMFDGVDWYRRITLDVGSAIPELSFLAIFGLVVMGLSLLIFLFSDHARRPSRYAMVSIVLGIVSFALFPAFRGLNRPWHFYVLTPIFTACCITATVSFLSFCAERFESYVRIVRISFAIGLTLILVVSVRHGIGLLERIERNKGACITSTALYDAYGAVRASNLKTIYAVNYSLAFPIFVLSEGTIHVEDLTWTELTPERIEELFEKLRTSSEAGIVCRYCGNKDWDPDWIHWLNREPQFFDFMKKLEVENSSLDAVRFRDDRQTEFSLITRTGDRRGRAIAKNQAGR